MNAERRTSISGAFYGTDHAETAGTLGIAGAFGAKRVEEAAVPEAAPGN
ncbi:MAG: hypothetical protein GDA41_10885 [Rhodospirillales bacterium]|nr:hypothetical protein [Rhodospirillales bacterium]